MAEPGIAPDSVARCIIVVGTRPEAIKVVPVILELQRSPYIEPLVVSTGQHRELVASVLGLAGIEPDVTLDAGREGQTLNSITHAVIEGFEELLYDLRGGAPERRTRPRLTSPFSKGRPQFPGFTMVHGDTTSALAAGLASAYARLPVFHLEAGLRTGNLLSPFPEELNRRLLSHLSSFHLAPTLANKESLIREGIKGDTIFVTGNTGIDALQWAAALDEPWPDPRLEGIDDGRIVIAVTAHRRENWGDGLRGIAEGIARICRARPDVTVVLPLHPNPRVRAELTAVLDAIPNVILTDPLDYVAFARLLKVATLAITDSGGIQEEGPSIGTPVLVCRETTERPEGVEAGTLRLVGTDPDVIEQEALALLDNPLEYARMRAAENPFGDGHAAERIVGAFEHLIFGGPPPRPFGSDFSRLSVIEMAGYETFDEEDDSVEGAEE
ncbi:MAG: UDP-N-acetylglucosamine 2-epimerase (non-hydrolyzing) [Actinomycetota bacterium]|nr:UDP-N-acetylglucosamine 2-epimerase (non-hydrolyzing) [Actinomycetota bacterium]